MRTLRIVVRTRSGALPLIVAASVVPGTACGAKSGLDEWPDAAVAIGGGHSGIGGVSGLAASAGLGGSAIGGTSGSAAGMGGASGFTGGTGGAGGGTGAAPAMDCPGDIGGYGNVGVACPPNSWPPSGQTHTVPLPPIGVPADPTQICQATKEPVESGRSAHVTLTKTSPGNDVATADGFCAIDPALESSIVGVPVIEVIDANNTALTQMKVSGMTKQPGGWAFQASFPGPLLMDAPLASGYTYMKVRTTFEIACEPNQPARLVQAQTELHLCLCQGELAWMSSGSECTTCGITEAGPTPIVPRRGRDDLPLPRVARLRIVELARAANAVLLHAEHDAGADVAYQWHPSIGRIERLAPDVIAWFFDQSIADPFIQVAVLGDDVAAIASFAFDGRV